MDARAHSSLLALLAEDRHEIRAARASIVSYSATFVSAILATIGASRGDTPILDKKESVLLAIGLLLVYLCVSSVHYVGLRNTRRNLNRRETLLMGNDYSRDCVKVFYANPSDYEPAKHRTSTNGDTWFAGLIAIAATVSATVILLAQIISY